MFSDFFILNSHFKTFVLFLVDKEHIFWYIITKEQMFEQEGINMRCSYKIANRFRFTLFVALTIIILTVIANFMLGYGIADSATMPEYIEIEISNGDTLWSIAEKYMPDDVDIRKSVYELGKLNQITAEELTAGMTILVPTK